MKKLITIPTLSFVILLVVSTNVVQAKTTDNNLPKDTIPMELHLLKDYLPAPVPINNEVTYKFFDSQDNLVYKAVVRMGECKEKILVKYLNESDLLTDVRGEKIHRLK